MSDFKTMDNVIRVFFDKLPKPYIAYCDYIAKVISKELKANDSEKLLSSVGSPKFDLDGNGAFRSTKKTIDVEDRYGKKYRITVEEV